MRREDAGVQLFGCQKQLANAQNALALSRDQVSGEIKRIFL